MRTYSFFARQRAKRQQFKYDMTRLLVSLKFRPRNWLYRSPCRFENKTEKMDIWVGNQLYGLGFQVDTRTYGGVTAMSSFFPWAIRWRRKVMRAAMEAAQSPWIEKYKVWD